MLRVRTKICGITNTVDALCAVNAGADAIGLVFYPQSPRSISIHKAREICAVIPPFVTVVGLFVNESQEQIETVCRELPLGLIQFHGDEQETECSVFNVPYIKAIKVRTDRDVADARKQFGSAQAILVDTYQKGVAGGTGEVFDWSLLPQNNNESQNRNAHQEDSIPLILAGGLNPDNVRHAIQAVQPYAVDVSGGVEQAKGIKDHQKVIRFIQEVSRG